MGRHEQFESQPPAAAQAMAAQSLHFLHIGALIASALYLAACLTLGYLTHNGPAWKLALLATGVTYLSHIGQIAYAHLAVNADASGYHRLAIMWRANWALLGGSIMLGALAGVALLIGS